MNTKAPCGGRIVLCVGTIKPWELLEIRPTTALNKIGAIMFKVGTSIVTALALIALAIATWQRFFAGADRAASNQADQSSLATLPAPAISHLEAITSSPSLHSTQRRKSEASSQSLDQSSKSLSEAVHASAPETRGSAATIRQDSGAEPQISLSIEPEVTDPDAVIGRPFPISASVESNCRHWSKNDAGDMCGEVQQLLSKMAQEPRDPTWARKMEEALRDHVTTEEPGKFSIRAIECRTSVCAVEVESIHGPYLGGIYPDHPASKDLSTWLPIRAYETNEYGARVTVTVMTFTRR